MRLISWVAVLAVIASSCTLRPSSAGGNVHSAADLYAANPTLADVRSLLGDSNWWPVSADAVTWVDELRGQNSFDPTGIATFYNTGSGEYFSLFTAGTKAAILVCRSTADVEAASRACELPMSRIAPAWLLSLTSG